jgi:DNA-binding transcriptional MerR regulator
MSQSVFCIARDRTHAVSILDRVRAAGFPISDISVLMAHESANGEIEFTENTKAPEGATAGAGTGLLLGGAVGWLAGIGALAIPGVGPFVAAGPIMAALSGAAIGATAGGVSGGLIGMGFSEYEANRYEEHLTSGNALISVRCESDEQVKRVKKIFKDEDAESISVQSLIDTDEDE